ncbi:M20 family metallopeptidase [Actinophytocola oryzae]|uniref:Glutamate carboxypeptidase n=1 Tax=Actinophytocola oryzae TaxID=502181 RepID=A0A4R7W414_9PSEU|nr:M20 family metallopeptidase [Actinophytocola oryzae]TDV57423.1 glutamate carboxypeptidase [Actinophytocola oryzae]
MLAELLADTEELVRCESPSSDPEALARSADVVARVGERRLGVAPERLGIHLRWRLGDGSGVLLLGHHDTVWPLGTLDTHPYTVDGGVMRGPGCFDMKVGLAMAFHAAAGRSGVTVLVTGDEEIGSPGSRELIEEEARKAGAALVLEASADGGALKTERKGVSNYEVVVTGRAAHAGLEPERGHNATIELAHQILAIAALADPSRGTTVTPTLLSSGTSVNTVPARGSVAVDVRVLDEAEQTRVDVAMRALRPVVPGTTLELRGGPNRPPLQASASEALFARAAALSKELGLPDLRGVAVGGASDGNFTAGVGTPTLDGLGAIGGGAHADDEHVLVDALPDRARLLAALVEDLLAGATTPSARTGAPRP